MPLLSVPSLLTPIESRRSSKSHAVTRYLQSRAPGIAAMGGQQTEEEIFQASVKDFFDIELLNRIDETVVFSHLDDKIAHQIARNELEILRARLRRKSIEVTVEDGVIKDLIAKGFDPVFGARSLRRVIRTQVAATVADCILGASAHARQHPLTVLVHTDNGQIRARLQPSEKALKR